MVKISLISRVVVFLRVMMSTMLVGVAVVVMMVNVAGAYYENLDEVPTARTRSAPGSPDSVRYAGNKESVKNTRRSGSTQNIVGDSNVYDKVSLVVALVGIVVALGGFAIPLVQWVKDSSVERLRKELLEIRRESLLLAQRLRKIHVTHENVQEIKDRYARFLADHKSAGNIPLEQVRLEAICHGVAAEDPQVVLRSLRNLSNFINNPRGPYEQAIWRFLIRLHEESHFVQKGEAVSGFLEGKIIKGIYGVSAVPRPCGFGK